MERSASKVHSMEADRAYLRGRSYGAVEGDGVAAGGL